MSGKLADRQPFSIDLEGGIDCRRAEMAASDPSVCVVDNFRRSVAGRWEPVLPFDSVEAQDGLGASLNLDSLYRFNGATYASGSHSGGTGVAYKLSPHGTWLKDITVEAKQQRDEYKLDVPGAYGYQWSGEIDGSGVTGGPHSYVMSRPNPAGATTIRYLDKDGLTLNSYDLSNVRLMRTVTGGNTNMPSGVYVFQTSGSNLIPVRLTPTGPSNAPALLGANSNRVDEVGARSGIIYVASTAGVKRYDTTGSPGSGYTATHTIANPGYGALPATNPITASRAGDLNYQVDTAVDVPTHSALNVNADGSVSYLAIANTSVIPAYPEYNGYLTSLVFYRGYRQMRLSGSTLSTVTSTTAYDSGDEVASYCSVSEDIQVIEYGPVQHLETYEEYNRYNLRSPYTSPDMSISGEGVSSWYDRGTGVYTTVAGTGNTSAQSKFPGIQLLSAMKSNKIVVAIKGPTASCGVMDFTTVVASTSNTPTIVAFAEGQGLVGTDVLGSKTSRRWLQPTVTPAAVSDPNALIAYYTLDATPDWRGRALSNYTINESSRLVVPVLGDAVVTNAAHNLMMSKPGDFIVQQKAPVVNTVNFSVKAGFGYPPAGLGGGTSPWLFKHFALNDYFLYRLIGYTHTPSGGRVTTLLGEAKLTMDQLTRTQSPGGSYQAFILVNYTYSGLNFDGVEVYRSSVNPGIDPVFRKVTFLPRLSGGATGSGPIIANSYVDNTSDEELGAQLDESANSVIPSNDTWKQVGTTGQVFYYDDKRVVRGVFINGVVRPSLDVSVELPSRVLTAQMMEDYLVAFTATQIYVINSDATSTGLGSIEASLLHDGVGGDFSDSVQAGIVFHFGGGIYVLNRSLQVVEVGDRVRGTFRRVYRILNSPLSREIFFLVDMLKRDGHNDGSGILVYNVTHDCWSRIRLPGGITQIGSGDVPIQTVDIATYVTSAGTGKLLIADTLKNTTGGFFVNHTELDLLPQSLDFRATLPPYLDSDYYHGSSGSLNYRQHVLETNWIAPFGRYVTFRVDSALVDGAAEPQVLNNELATLEVMYDLDSTVVETYEVSKLPIVSTTTSTGFSEVVKFKSRAQTHAVKFRLRFKRPVYPESVGVMVTGETGVHASKTIRS